MTGVENRWQERGTLKSKRRNAVFWFLSNVNFLFGHSSSSAASCVRWLAQTA
jgi:hypothetical protein